MPILPCGAQGQGKKKLMMKYTMKNTLRPGSIALGLGLSNHIAGSLWLSRFEKMLSSVHRSGGIQVDIKRKTYLKNQLSALVVGVESTMSRCTYRLFLILGVAIFASTVNAQSGSRRVEHAVVEDLQPFTHTALIPVGSDLSSIRFQRVKAVSVPTRRRSTMDERYCAEAAFRDPGGSMYCPSVRSEGFTRAYEVTYAIEGQPLASDEHSNRRFTFSVYFRPDELSAAEWAALARAGRTNAAGLLKLNTSRMLEERWVIDEDHSVFCGGDYRDGSWVQANPQCEDKVDFKRVMVPSDYFAVRVDLDASREVAGTSTK
jgi:hypothetical protein